MSYGKQIKQRNSDFSAESETGQKADEQLEKLEKTEEADVAEENSGETANYGKFGSLQELLSAYNALQSEFTKRCQLVKQLQTRLDEMNAQALSDGTAEEDTESIDRVASSAENALARSSACDGEARLAEAIAVIAEHIEDCADYLASLPQIADAVILTYKKKLLGFSSSPSPRGMAVVMPAKRPRTLEEAKRLADEMLKSGR